jgi:hypothetical protein
MKKVELPFLIGVAGYRTANSESNKDISDKLGTVVNFNGTIKEVVE